MFYDEQVINGKLHCRHSPSEAWRLATGPRAVAFDALMALDSDARSELFTLFFCHSCGAQNPRCQCWNDD